MRHALVLLAPTALLAGCGDPPSKPAAAPPSHAEPVAHETELLRLTLTPEAQRRLGIETVRVGGGAADAMRQAAGEIVVPAGSASAVPIGSTANLQQIGAQQAAADGEVARATAQLRLARIALNRAEALVREEAGSVRARDEAAAALATAEAALAVARQQRGLLGPSVAAMGAQSHLWVRVTLFASDLAALRRDATAIVRALGDAGGASQPARPVQGPPSANSTAGTVDLFYALPNPGRRYRIGQRVAVSLPLAGRTEGLMVPSSAIVRDIYGGEWVYRRGEKGSFIRSRIEVASEADGRALLSRGLAAGDEVVSVGAAELFGTEFGAAH